MTKASSVAMVIIVIMAGSVSGCVNLNPYAHELRVAAGAQPPQEAIERYIQDYLRRTLKDPDPERTYKGLSFDT